MTDIKLVYFSWVRERVGCADEVVSVPDTVITVSDLAAWLATRDEGYAAAFEHPRLVRAALDRVHAKPDDPIASAREIAFFPPMTGG